MHFHWIFEEGRERADPRFLIDLEYRLRPRITRFLMDRLGMDCCEDFTCFHFEVDMGRREIRISDQTPERYARLLCVDFQREISANCC